MDSTSRVPPPRLRRLGPYLVGFGLAIILGLAALAAWQGWPFARGIGGPATALGILTAGLVVGSGVLWFRWQSSQTRLRRLQVQLSQVQGRMGAILKVSNRFAQAKNERDIAELVLSLCLEYAGALGASFVPLDERGLPLDAISLGHLPSHLLEDWTEHLSSPGVRQACAICRIHAADIHHPCPLVSSPFTGAYSVACLPVRWAGREVGTLNLYLPEGGELDGEARQFLAAMVDEMSVALEAIRLREKEVNTLREIRTLQAAGLEDVVPIALHMAIQLAGGDYAYLDLPGGAWPAPVEVGCIPEDVRPRLVELVRKVTAGPEGRGELPGDRMPLARLGRGGAISHAVTGEAGQVVGGLVVGYLDHEHPDPAQFAVVEAIAGQVALLVRSAKLAGELEYQAMMAERTRLAREIHDGLAQTLGYLKLVSAQMVAYLERGDLEKLGQTLEQAREVLAEAYQDARQAIDGLRLAPDGGVQAWITQAVEEFEALAGLPVHTTGLEVPIEVTQEVQAQLIRIIQEALTNVRKHACAQQVWLTCREWAGDLILEIRDDGQGFEPGDVIEIAQHGIRGMRERAQLIGGDFQIRSRPERGTTVEMRLPLKRHGGDS